MMRVLPGPTTSPRHMCLVAVLLALSVITAAGCVEYRSPQSVIDETRRQFGELRACLGPFPGGAGEVVSESEGDVGFKWYFATFMLPNEESSVTIASKTDMWWRDRCGVKASYPAGSQRCPSSASYGGSMSLQIALTTDQPSPAVECASKGDRVRLLAKATLPPGL